MISSLALLLMPACVACVAAYDCVACVAAFACIACIAYVACAAANACFKSVLMMNQKLLRLPLRTRVARTNQACCMFSQA